jgi:hypothetical protein
MKKIEFHGEEIELSKAKTLLNKLKNGEINLELTENERIEYNHLKDILHEDISTEQSYLVFLLGMKIGIREGINKINYMEEHGYFDFDKMTPEETRKFNKLLRTPFMHSNI